MARSTSGVCRSARTRTNLAAENPTETLRVVTYQQDNRSAIRQAGYPLCGLTPHALASATGIGGGSASLDRFDDGWMRRHRASM
eukprot:scaffold24853_cov129-Isochrysis_galbana.AAC.2